MIKYYTYQDHNYDIQKCIQSISDIYDTDQVISLPEKSYLLRVPFIQRYKGIALVLSSSLLLKNKIDLENIDFEGNFGVTNKNDTLFIINCEHEHAINNLNKSTMVMSPLRNADILKARWNINNEIDNFVLKQEDENITFLGQAKNESSVGK